mmetsp:Transcript_24511/g.80015  ORF Transcript_24511/g.80015 Transcript_24511/m.80015 type:complete len:207 (+) Transcript_24511:2457-3077(+)
MNEGMRHVEDVVVRTLRKSHHRAGASRVDGHPRSRNNAAAVVEFVLTTHWVGGARWARDDIIVRRAKVIAAFAEAAVKVVRLDIIDVVVVNRHVAERTIITAWLVIPRVTHPPWTAVKRGPTWAIRAIERVAIGRPVLRPVDARQHAHQPGKIPIQLRVGEIVEYRPVRRPARNHLVHSELPTSVIRDCLVRPAHAFEARIDGVDG